MSDEYNVIQAKLFQEFFEDRCLVHEAILVPAGLIRITKTLEVKKDATVMSRKLFNKISPRV